MVLPGCFGCVFFHGLLFVWGALSGLQLRSRCRLGAAPILLGSLLLPHPALPLFEEFCLRTSPPLAAAIELSDVELAAI
jgi:hypothetical protein